MGCFACNASKVFLLFLCSRHEVQVTFPQANVKVTMLAINSECLLIEYFVRRLGLRSRGICVAWYV